METHVLLGAEHVLRGAGTFRDAVTGFTRAVETLQLEHLRHEEQMRQIVAAFAEAVGHMR